MPGPRGGRAGVSRAWPPRLRASARVSPRRRRLSASAPGARPAPKEPAPAEAAPEAPAKPAGPRFILYENKKVKAVYPVDKPEMLIGRSPECDIHIDEQTISRVHARVTAKPDKFVVEDLNSLNGTYINNDAIKRGHIEDKDSVTVGNVALVFRTT